MDGADAIAVLLDDDVGLGGSWACNVTFDVISNFGSRPLLGCLKSFTTSVKRCKFQDGRIPGGSHIRKSFH